MRVEARNPTSGETIFVDVPDDQKDELMELTRDRVSNSKLEAYIDNLDISADAKALLASFLKTAVRVGQVVVRVGKRIVEIVVAIVAKFPKATFGMILGLLVGALVAAIPLLGALLAAFVAPIAALFGLAKGYMEDLQDQALSRKIAEATAMFEPLKGEVNVAG